MFKKFCAILATIILSAGLFWSPHASALEQGDIVMSLNPSELELELTAGETYQASVGVSNVGRLPFDVKASVSPYYVNDKYEPDFETQSSYTKLFNWIKLEQNSYHLEPGETKRVNFIIEVPKDIVGGGQYAAIMLLSDSGIEEEAAVKVQGRLAAIVYGHIEGAEMVKSGELVAHSLPSFMFNESFSVSQTIKNTGNVDFRVRQVMIVKDYFSNREVVNADSVSSDGHMIGSSNSTILPGTTRTNILTWTEAPKLGLFEVRQDISFLDQEYSFTQVVLICPIWLLLVVLVIIIAIIVRIIYKAKNHKRRSTESASDEE